MRDRLRAGQVSEVWWIDTRDMITDALSKGGIDRSTIRLFWSSGVIVLVGDAPIRWTAPLAEQTAAQAATAFMF
eukprot:3277530-Heterocapsa_arctica.AAC.1